MAYQHKMQRNRFEYKYLIDERCAHEVRNFARSYLVHDEFARAEMKWASWHEASTAWHLK